MQFIKDDIFNQFGVTSDPHSHEMLPDDYKAAIKGM